MTEPYQYKHILAAVDMTEKNRKVIAKAVDRARANQAKLSVIHVDVDLKDLYTEMIDIDIDNIQDQVVADAKQRLEEYLGDINYPIEKKLVICGDLTLKVNEAVEQNQIDLLVCGHEQSFWSLLTSSARQLMNTVPCDMLVVPLPKD
ncbi:universal stress protein [Zobellella taiwanensis]|jgi:universal stress protein A|uniref:Universal stress protein n=1 Tax=Zobellella taiwanensis TaxID=347535 RepID=A0A2P7QL02_9GAMM|nr:universal stress protein [Zobellella taiwanensis]PSJ38659.1 universal stress protein [Zobellella taiwanensis]